MTCEICGRGSCTRIFHSFEAQERHDTKLKMSDDVDELREEILDLREKARKTSDDGTEVPFYAPFTEVKPEPQTWTCPETGHEHIL